MTGLTPAQAERLRNLQRRRSQVTNDIQTLQRAERGMSNVRERIKSTVSRFRDASRKNQSEWRGQTGTRYDGDRNQANANAATCLSQMSDVIQRASQQRSRLSNQLTNINTSIRELERIAASGGV